MILHVALAIGALLVGLFLFSIRGVERFVGWRYLFRRRSSPMVRNLTIFFGLITALLIGLFFFGRFAPGGTGQTILMLLTEPAMEVFVVLLFLNLFSVFTTVSIIGVFLGVKALIVVLSVTSGFQEEFQTKVLGANAHVIVLKYGLDFSEYRDVIKQAEALPHVVAAGPFIFHEMMIANGGRHAGVLVKGVQPGVSDKVLDVGTWMTEGSIDTLRRASKDAPSSIVIGRELARKLKVKVGDKVRVISPLGDLDPSMWDKGGKDPKIREFRIGGIFYSGFDEYDRRLVCIDLTEAQAFIENGDVVTGVEMRIDDIYLSDGVALQLDHALGTGPYRVIDWRELNHNLFTALKLQKLALAILLTLIVLVAAFGIVATLTMLVIDKTREIAILKSVGMRGASIARLFQAAGMTIGGLGTLAGIAHGMLICLMMSRYQYHLDPKVYLIDKLPVRISAVEIGLTALVTMAICFFATIYPSLRAAGLKPVEGLRYE